MVNLNVGCLTCLQPSDLDAQHVLSTASIQDALRKHFWFTETDLQQAIICQSCWEQVNNFYRFYTSVEELYQNQTSYGVKPEPEADQFDCLEEVSPEFSSVNLDVEAEQLENLNSENSVLSDKEHVGLQEDKDVSANVDIVADEPLWRRKTLFQHVKLLENPDMLHCQKCETSFKGRRAYHYHRNRCHASGSGDRIFDCDQCPRSFANHHHFKEHLENHAGHWKCEKCNKKFINETRLKQHVTRAHPELPLLTCDVCPKMYRLNSLMLLHEQTHTQQQCQLCPRMLPDRKSLRAHARIIHPDAMICYTCKKVLPTREALQAHKVQAHWSRDTPDDHRRLPLEADDCDVFPMKSHGKTLNVENIELYHNLRVVLNDVLKEGRTECPIQTVDVEKNQLISYIDVKEEPVTVDPNKEIVQHKQDPLDSKRKVTSKKIRRRTADEYIRKHVKYICDKCGQESPTFHLFMNHALEKHDDQLAFVACCGKKFQRKYALFQHVQTQNNPNMFRCEDCKISFQTKANYRRHLYNVHGDKKYKCDHCSKSYASKDILWRHRREHWPEKNMNCPLCGKLFPTQKKIKRHIERLHPDSPKFTCDVCSQKFSSESWLQEHMIKHKELQCLFCPERFPSGKKLRDHVLKQHHGVELPKMCTICRDVLPNKNALDAHKVQNHMRQTMFTEEEFNSQPELESSIDVDEEQVIEEQSEMTVQQDEEQNDSYNSEDEMEDEDLDDSELSVIIQNSRGTEPTVKRYQDGKRLHDHASDLPSSFALEALRIQESEQHNMLSDENDYDSDSTVTTEQLESCIDGKEEQVIEEQTKKAIRHVENSDGQQEQDGSESTVVKEKKGKWSSFRDEYIRKHVKYICKKCGHESLKFLDFTKHAWNVHGNEWPTIECCGKIFRSKYPLYEHVYRTNNPDSVHRCEQCNKSFGHQTVYRQHMRRHHVANIKCNQCAKRFVNKHMLKMHIRDRMYIDHHLDSDKTWRSEHVYRNRTSSRDQRLELPSSDGHGAQEHEDQYNLVSIIVKSETKVGDDNFLEDDLPECSNEKSVETEQREGTRCDGDLDKPVCMPMVEGLDPDDLKQLKQLLMEEELIKEHVQYKCEHCSEESLSYEHFKHHVRHAHNVPAVVRCCGKKFEQRNSLLQHVQLMNNPNAFRCKHCLKRFSTKSLLKKHIQKLHASKAENTRHLEDHAVSEGVKRKCEYCNVTFKNHTRHDRHIRMKHTDAPKKFCDVCCTGFVLEAWYLEHMQGHDREDALAGTFKCGLCSECFIDKTQRKLHVQDHAGWELDSWEQQFAMKPQYVCTLCSKAFHSQPMFQQHNLKHEKPALKCPDCPKQFLDDKLFVAHVQVSHLKKRYFCQRCQIGFPSLQAFQDHKVLEHGAKRNCRYCAKSFDNHELLEDHIVTAHSTSKPHVCTVCAKGFLINYNLRRHMIIEHQGENQEHSASGSNKEK